MKTAELLDLKVEDVMTKDLITIGENEVMSRVDSILKEHKINHLPVVDQDDQLLGIVTKNDVQLLKDWATNLKLDTANHYNSQLLNSQTAKDRMNPIQVTVSPSDNLKKCAEIFKKNVFHALPVTVDGRLVGIITTYDLLCIAFSE